MCSWLMDLHLPGVGDLGKCACVVGASHACRSRRYTLASQLRCTHTFVSRHLYSTSHHAARCDVRSITSMLFLKILSGGGPLFAAGFTANLAFEGKSLRRVCRRHQHQIHRASLPTRCGVECGMGVPQGVPKTASHNTKTIRPPA